MKKLKPLQVRKWGNGLGIFLSRALADAAGLELGSEITPAVKAPGEIVFASGQKTPAIAVTDFSELILLEVDGVVIPLKRETAIALAGKTGSRDGFVDAGDQVELSVTPDAGCIKLRLDPKTATALKKQLADLDR